MSGSLIRRVVPFLVARIRDNHRMLSFSSVSALNEASPSSVSSSSSHSESHSPDAVHLSQSCIQRMKELQDSESEKKMLRLGVETGGCSGFQYVFELDSKTNSDDRVFERDGVKLVVDNVSYDFVKGATVDYVEELIRSAFVVAENPSAVGGCSCKSSFMVKQ
ncbi:PREDICTED: iron-sulfur assembly protein IscA-like 2, mitochondrial [Tarenaya hassleriana]|uniref:iron-sulfur assembly protein IscA-like 2, mitochondrial n=1 Tax=Tarenaya hassleriana TaxID=28532 RepID=UPI00053C15A0|nr:PREDICTED: iron-sulfur assembly protein IscA-like 2, mitochondrial [Tarenaya hassleriana]XP_010552981.1 PREDICTED: iron-sulfur assembly protein IscA-like 2, mitochondrial [Tarenaya hassleriana]